MKLRIDSPIVPGTRRTAVELDRVDVCKAIRGLDIQMRVGEVIGVSFDVLIQDGLSFEGDLVSVDVPEETAALLRRIGWLPPLTALGMLPAATADRLRELRAEYAGLIDPLRPAALDGRPAGG